jgi:anaerobic magnesium-protoporphyrin IX monomethyl ester cyclase
MRTEPLQSMIQTDCLIIGYNDHDFDGNVRLVESTGKRSGSFRDFRLSCIEYKSRYQRPLDILSLFNARGDEPGHRFHDMDFLWPTITYLGTYLHRHGLSFGYVNLFQFEKEKLKTILTTCDVLTVVITTTLYVHPRPIIEIVEFVRRHNSQVRIIVGGPYVSNQCSCLNSSDFAQLLCYIGADYYVVNREGEESLVALLRALKSGSELKSVTNLAYFDNNTFIRTSDVPERNSLEENLVDYTLFSKSEIGEFLSIRTSKSCPFACAFCGFPERSGDYVYLKPDIVEAELNRINDLMKISTLTFLDDTFNVPKSRFREILLMMIRNRYDFKWNCYYRCDRGDQEIIDLMGKAGCEGVFLGIESGSDVLLERMNKKCKSREYREAIPQLKAAGISTHANIIVGFPGETRETFEESIELLEYTAPDFYLGQLWFCDPITPAGRRRKELGVEGTGFTWTHGTMDYKEACDLVEEMFFRVQNALWLPQWGMAPWSTYYLQRKGMTLAQVKRFVRCFNDVVGHQVRNPDDDTIPDALLKLLKESCKMPEPRLQNEYLGI